MIQPRWKYKASIYTEREHCTVFRDDALRVQKQIMIKRNWRWFRPKERVFYFLDEVPAVFRAEEDLVRELRHRMARSRAHRHDLRSRLATLAWE